MNESGQAQVLSLVVLFLLLTVAAGLVDIIYLASDRRQVQWLADAAARAAVSQVVRAEAKGARDAALEVIGKNERPAGGPITADQIELDLGRWRVNTGFEADVRPLDSVQVTVHREIRPLLGRAIGLHGYDYEVAAAATAPGRDVIFVLDMWWAMVPSGPVKGNRFRDLPAENRELARSRSGYYRLPPGRFYRPSVGEFTVTRGDGHWYYAPNESITYLGGGLGRGCRRHYECFPSWRYIACGVAPEPVHSMKVSALEIAKALDLGRTDRAGVVSFDVEAKLRLELTDDLGAISREIMELAPGGVVVGQPGDPAGGIRAAVDHLNAASPSSRIRQKTIILAGYGTGDALEAGREAGRARDTGITIVVISVTGDGTDAMRAAATAARGSHYFAHTPEGIVRIFREASNKFSASLPSVLTE